MSTRPDSFQISIYATTPINTSCLAIVGGNGNGGNGRADGVFNIDRRAVDGATRIDDAILPTTDGDANIDVDDIVDDGVVGTPSLRGVCTATRNTDDGAFEGVDAIDGVAEDADIRDGVDNNRLSLVPLLLLILVDDLSFGVTGDRFGNGMTAGGGTLTRDDEPFPLLFLSGVGVDDT
jgi:hypothetical protein